MKAVLLDKPGPPSSLRIGEISLPRPGFDEALVRVCATSLNPVDYKVAAQGYEGWHYPHILGIDVAGVIEKTGESVVSWNVGDQFFTIAPGGRTDLTPNSMLRPLTRSLGSLKESPWSTPQHCPARP
jgi:NADPH:quinone reductase-like Zn-dependent oxidoreductase